MTLHFDKGFKKKEKRDSKLSYRTMCFLKRVGVFRTRNTKAIVSKGNLLKDKRGDFLEKEIGYATNRFKKKKKEKGRGKKIRRRRNKLERKNR